MLPAMKAVVASPFLPPRLVTGALATTA